MVTTYLALALGFGISANPSNERPNMSINIYPIVLGFDHAYIIQDEGIIMVDGGESGKGPAICLDDGLPRYWVNTATLNLVVQDTEFSISGILSTS